MIRAFLSFLETRGAGAARKSELREALADDGDAGRAALIAEGVIRPGSIATTHPCEGVGCAREVRELTRASDGTRRYVAVCTQEPRECETLDLREHELLEDVIVESAFWEVVRRELRVEAPLAARKTAELVGPETPVLLGEQVAYGQARDVFFTRRTGAPALRTLLAERRTAARGAIVLVPTARGLDPELLRYAPGSVEIAALTDLLSVRGTKIVAVPQLKLVGSASAPRAEVTAEKGARAVDRLPRAERWGDVTFYWVPDEGQIGVEIDRRRQCFTAGDLGMVAIRSRAPVRAFELLRRICDGDGHFDTRRWGNNVNGRKIVSELRKALSAAFEIAESPFEAYSKRTKSWKTRFRATSRGPGEG